ncbi:MAG: Asp-tRNA(Asn)/Glu-tRNA(Gln) amidotransferase subunit GatC [Candidatus Methanomethylophilus sp.]|nr:Asp-tRNA(Asn)/Glu-tRNA(Gln) amidotransferase subunit GatC [Methanomethylophilus sp.]MDD3233559.1 Asp-tRNA(Asn)/Glu-tRNA(Gln) amidotransferase subunit GatC [Methanomethylophilus sp.]MDD4221871.1 Asp-tRNA(Asn)/Glu-tRNA(Gln) amidotransferase subunit GatC [Methanomethylophilus sp.]MDD4668396.1 Asp-tRNA(Asn)/Glu-tRNA(Gln) amidotransferase subunit GatC [Methanomethylophilus sp.]
MDRDIVAKVAKTAHLTLTDAELDRYSRDLREILDYFRVLDEAPNHTGVGVNPVEIADVLRDDVPRQEFSSEDLLKDMKTYKNYIRGPKLS